MSEAYVLDSSAVICLLGNEHGFQLVQDIAEQAVISAVNLAEVVAKLQERGGSKEDIIASLDDLHLNIISFDQSQALHAGLLRNVTRIRGLSLGDRACLALAASRKAIAVTTDKAWAELAGIPQVLVVR
jgi:ribonuclease VapC